MATNILKTGYVPQNSDNVEVSHMRLKWDTSSVITLAVCYILAYTIIN